MTKPGLWSRAAWTIVGLLWVVATLNYLDRQLVVTMPGPIKADLQIGDERFGLLSSVFLWVYGLCSPLAGYVADRVGKRPVIIASLLLWSVATFVSGIVTSFEGMLAARAMLGVSEAFYMPAAVALIVEYHRGSTRSRATGLHLSGVYVGSVLGGLGGAFAEMFGWRTGFLIMGAIGVAYALVLMIVFPQPPQKTEPSEDSPAQSATLSLPRAGAFASLLTTRGFLFLLAMNLLNGAA
jgi:predicted MFS family arabinose efflux permease